jgi:3'-phosphoadenosine 5'-phosphosulfate sulfotransferase (PAPS reductase)/FAD synthetase
VAPDVFSPAKRSEMMRRVYDVFVTGGRDSTCAAAVACREAEELGIPCRLIFIDETKAFGVPEGFMPYRPLDYVKELSKFLGVELLVLEPRFDFWEGVRRWGYPHLRHHRWCYHFLKERPLLELAQEERSQGIQPTWVTGIRRGESRRRAELYRLKRYHRRVGRFWVEYYHPILDWSDGQVDAFLRGLEGEGLPKNLLWDAGFSCECLCMAGTTRRQLDRLIALCPELAKWLAQRDEEVQAFMRKHASYVRPLYGLRRTLREYVEERLRQRTLQDFVAEGPRR